MSSVSGGFGIRYTARTYTTNFPGTENPISESSNWINGATTGLDWKDMQTTPGLAFGPANFTSNKYDDSTAIVSGSWAPNHAVEATVKSLNQLNGSNFEEVELRLRTTITAHSIQGYEINYRCSHDGSQYHQIGQWYGPLGHTDGTPCTLGCAFDGVPGSVNAGSNGMQSGDNCFDQTAATAAWGTTTYGGLFDGDTIGASMIDNQITTWIIHNGVKVILQQFRDTGGAGGGPLYIAGSPGMGHWFHSASGSVSDFGLTSFTARNV